MKSNFKTMVLSITIVLLVSMQVFSQNNDDSDNSYYGLKGFGSIPVTSEQLKNALVRQDSMYKDYLSQKNLPKTETIPDWRSMMSIPEDQGSCGDCWVHAATGVTECKFHILLGQNINIDMDELEIPLACYGGFCYQAETFILNNKMRSEVGSYPNLEGVRWGISSYSSVSGINNIKSALVNGPVTAAFDLRQDFGPFFNNNPTGVYRWDGTSQHICYHAVVIVSYGSDAIGEYWLCKNSGGTGWADGGYFRIGFGQCLMESLENTYVTVNQSCLAKIIPNLISSLTTACSYGFKTNEWAQILSSTTISSGTTCTVPSNGYLSFQNGSVLNVNGTLTAIGTSNNRITFTGATRGCWGGIYFNSSSTGSVIMYCNIKNASYGIVINNTSPCIGECFIDDPYYYGIYIQGSSANPSIAQNYIEGNTACVVHYNGGNGWLTNNSFRNSNYGVMIYSGSPCYDYDNIGRNKFETSINWHKVYVASGQPWLGQYQYFTVPNASYKYIYSLSASTIDAETDYWSAYPPSDSYFYGTVNRSYPLQNPPNPAAGPNWSLPKSSGGDFFTEFKAASLLFYNKKYEEAREQFKMLTEKYLDSEYSSYSLNWYMLATEQLENIEEQTEYLNSIKKNESAHKNTRFYALKWLLQTELRSGSTENAKKLASEVEVGSVYDWEISLDLAMGLSANKNDKQGAEDILNGLTGRFTDNEHAESINLIRNIMDNIAVTNAPIFSEGSKNNELNKTSNQTPFNYELIGNYPNPFNPTTIIKYALPKESDVQLTIYDIMGREVKTLVTSKQEAGYKEVIWNGTDNNNQKVSSGIYLYRLRATSTEDLKVFEKSAKLVLIK